MQIIKVLHGRVVAMHWRYKLVELTLKRHSTFALGPFPALQTLLDHATVVLTVIEPPAASAPCELCYCLVRVTGVCTYLLLPLINRCCLTCLGWVTVPPFSVP